MSLNSIPISTLREYIDIRNQKNIVVKNQKYSEAATLRDQERSIQNIYPVIMNYTHDEIMSYVNIEYRNNQINTILDE